MEAIKRKENKKQETSHNADHMNELITQFSKLKEDFQKQGIKKNQLYRTFINHIRSPTHLKTKKELSVAWKRFRKFVFFIFLPFVVVFLGYSYLNEQSFLYGEDGWITYIRETKCILESGGLLAEVTRPEANCDMCRHLTEVPVVPDLTREEFVKKYAYSGVPVIIKQATRGWTALETFSFQYFKNIYTNTSDALELTIRECQFFPYESGFSSLGDAFNMSDARADFKPGEKSWYIGWSNCQPEVAKELRQHYRKPHFLPPESESSFLDWIFMGGPGPGAFIHLDFVVRPSWQAQISGHKTWTLIPPPECEPVCRTVNATLERGDIIVVDSNQWYHSTFVHPGEVSICIGSEYD